MVCNIERSFVLSQRKIMMIIPEKVRIMRFAQTFYCRMGWYFHEDQPWCNEKAGRGTCNGCMVSLNESKGPSLVRVNVEKDSLVLSYKVII